MMMSNGCIQNVPFNCIIEFLLRIVLVQLDVKNKVDQHRRGMFITLTGLVFPF